MWMLTVGYSWIRPRVIIIITIIASLGLIKLAIDPRDTREKIHLCLTDNKTVVEAFAGKLFIYHVEPAKVVEVTPCNKSSDWILIGKNADALIGIPMDCHIGTHEIKILHQNNSGFYLSRILVITRRREPDFIPSYFWGKVLIAMESSFKIDYITPQQKFHLITSLETIVNKTDSIYIFDTNMVNLQATLAAYKTLRIIQSPKNTNKTIKTILIWDIGSNSNLVLFNQSSWYRINYNTKKLIELFSQDIVYIKTYLFLPEAAKKRTKRQADSALTLRGSAPRTMYSLPQLNVSFCSLFLYDIPHDLFFDAEDGYTRNLSLSLHELDGSKVSKTSWIQLVPSGNVLLGLLSRENYQSNQGQIFSYYLIANDSSGLTARADVFIKGPDELPKVFYRVDVTLTKFFPQNDPDVYEEILISFKISLFIGDIWLHNFKLISFIGNETTNLVTLGWTNCSFSGNKCPWKPIQLLSTKLVLSNGTINPSFVNAMAPQYYVHRVKETLLDDCITMSSITAKSSSILDLQVSPSPVFSPPSILNNILPLTASTQQMFSFQIPNTTFYDIVDGYTNYLTLLLRNVDGSSLPKSSWIQLDSNRQLLLGILTTANLQGKTTKVFTYRLIAKNSRNYETALNLTIVGKSSNVSYGVEISFSGYDSSDAKVNDVVVLMNILSHLRTYMNDNSLSTVEVILFKRTSLERRFSIQWTNLTFTSNVCSKVELDIFRQSIQLFNGGINPRLVIAMSPVVGLQVISLLSYGNCIATIANSSSFHVLPSPKLDRPPVRTAPLLPLNVTMGILYAYTVPENIFYDTLDGYTRQLRLELREKDGKTAVGRRSWIQLNETTQTLHAFPTLSLLKGESEATYFYTIIVINSRNIEGKFNLTVNIQSRVSVLGILITFYGSEYNTRTWNDLTFITNLVLKLYYYFGPLYRNNIVIVSYERTLVPRPQFKVILSESRVSGAACDREIADQLQSFIYSSSGAINPNLQLAVAPNLVLSQVTMQRQGPCSTSSASISPTPTITQFPIITRAFPTLVAVTNEYFSYVIPSDIFFDAIDGNTRTLSIRMYGRDLVPLNPNSWLQFDEVTQSMYGMIYTQLFDSSSTINLEYILSVRNSRGFTSNFTLRVQGKIFLTNPGLEVTSTFRIYLSSIYTDIWIIGQVFHRTRVYFQDSRNDSIQLVKWTRVYTPNQEMVISWQYTQLTSHLCNAQLLYKVISLLLDTNGAVNPAYRTALAPEILVLDAQTAPYGNCISPVPVRTETSTPPLSPTAALSTMLFSKVSSAITAQSTFVPSSPPTLVKAVPPISVQFCKFLYYQIPADTFLDDDGDTRKLSLTLLQLDGTLPQVSSWIQFNPSVQVIYGFFKLSDFENKDKLSIQYTLAARNSKGKSIKTAVFLALPTSRKPVNYKVSMVTNRFYDASTPHVNEQLLLTSKISQYFASDINSILINSFTVSSNQRYVTTVWSNCTVPYQPCPRQEIQQISKKLLALPDVPQKALIDILRPQYTLERVLEDRLAPCHISVFSASFPSVFPTLQSVRASSSISKGFFSTFTFTPKLDQMTSFVTKVLYLSTPLDLTTLHPSSVSATPVSSSDTTNYPPVAINILGILRPEYCSPISHAISPYAFYDTEDGFARNLLLELKNKDGSSLDAQSWIQFDTRSQTVYGILKLSDMTISPQGKEYILVATDKGGLKTSQILRVSIPGTNTKPNNLIEFEVNLHSVQFKTQVDLQLQLRSKLQNYFTDIENNTIGFVAFAQKTNDSAIITVSWTNCTLNNNKCDQTSIQRLQDKLFVAHGVINPKLTAALSPTFEIQRLQLTGACLQYQSNIPSLTKFSQLSVHVLPTPFQNNTRPVVKTLIPVLNASICNYFHYSIPNDTFYDQEDGSTSTLNIFFLTEKGENLPNSSWVQLNRNDSTIYGILTDALFSDSSIVYQRYLLKVVDSGGLDVNQTLRIVGRRTERYPSFQITFRMRDYSSGSQNDVDALRDIMIRLGNYFRQDRLDNIRVINFKRVIGLPGSITFVWTNCSLQSTLCPNNLVLHLSTYLISTGNSPKVDLVLSFAPAFLVTAVKFEILRECVSDISTSYSVADTLLFSTSLPQFIEPSTAKMSFLVPMSSASVNLPPSVTSKIVSLTAYFCKPFSYQIPKDLFTDPEDGNTRKLTLILLWGNGTQLSKTSWIQLSRPYQTIYGILKVSDLENQPEDGYQFTLVAFDSRGQNASTTFSIAIPTHAPKVNHKLTLTVNRFYGPNIPDLDEELLLLTKISNFVGDPDIQKINVILFSRVITDSNITIVWSNCTLPYTPCPIQAITSLFSRFLSVQGQTTSSFQSALLPQYINSTIQTVKTGPCESMVLQSSLVSISRSVSINYPPRPSIQTVIRSVQFCSQFHYIIPVTLFSDEDGDSRSLNLSMLQNNMLPLSYDTWISFNKITQTVYGFFKSSDVSGKIWRNYTIVATDSLGLSSYVNLSLQVPTEKLNVTHQIVVQAIGYFRPELGNVDIIALYQAKLQKYLSKGTISILFNWISRQEGTNQEISLSYSYCSLTLDLCLVNDLYNALLENVFILPNILNPAYILSFAPEFVVKKVSPILSKQCPHSLLIATSLSSSQITLTETLSVSTNNIPRVFRKIPLLNTSLCALFEYKVPEDSFVDLEDGYANNLTLSLERIDGGPVNQDSWLIYNKTSMMLKGIPVKDIVDSSVDMEFRLKATDSKGATAYQSLKFNVKNQSSKIAYKITTLGLISSSSLSSQFDVLSEFRNNLGIYLGKEFHDLYQIISYEKVTSIPLQFSIHWSSCLLDYQPCNARLFSLLYNKLFQRLNVMREAFVIAMSPNLRLINTEIHFNKSCTSSFWQPYTSTILPSLFASTSISLHTSVLVNTPPIPGKASVDLNVGFCSPIEHILPNSTCADNEDGTIGNLNVYLTFLNQTRLPQNFWIQVKRLNQSLWRIRGILKTSDLIYFDNNITKFLLHCQDSRGLSSHQEVVIRIKQQYNVLYSDVISILSYLYTPTALTNLDIQFLWMHKIYSYFGYRGEGALHFHDFQVVPSAHKLYSFQFSSCSRRGNCNLEDSTTAKNEYLDELGRIQNRFLIACIPEFALVSLTFTTSPSCNYIPSPTGITATFGDRSRPHSINYSLFSKIITSLDGVSLYVTSSKEPFTISPTAYFLDTRLISPSPALTMKISSTPAPSFPVALVPFLKINISSCRTFTYQIPEKLFFDIRDGFTRNLSVEILRQDGVPIHNQSWLQMDSKLQIVKGIPNVKDFQVQTIQKYVLRATNSLGDSTIAELQIELIGGYAVPNHEVETIAYVYSRRFEEIYLKELFTTKLISFLQNTTTKGIQFSNFTLQQGVRTTVSLVWSSCNFLPQCDETSFLAFTEKMLLYGTLLNAKFVVAFLPQFVITSTHIIKDRCGGQYLSTASPQRVTTVPASLQGHTNSQLTSPISRSLNQPPRVNVPIRPIHIFLCSQLSYRIPENTFWDSEDGNTRKLRLSFLTFSGQELSKSSWVQFLPATQILYGLLKVSDIDVSISATTFRLVARDADGASVELLIKFVFPVAPTINFVVNMKYQRFFDIKTPDITSQFYLMTQIGKYFHDVTLTSILLIRFDRPDNNPVVSASWTNCTLIQKNCSLDEINVITSKLQSREGTINANFLKALQPPFEVLDVKVRLNSRCNITNIATSALATTTFISFAKSLSFTETKLQIGTSTSSYILFSTVILANPPRVLNPIKNQTVSVCGSFSYQIPYNTFTDDKGGNTRNFLLELRLGNNTAIPKDYWLQFSPPLQILYGIIRLSDLAQGSNTVFDFLLIAVNSQGLSASLKMYIVAPQVPQVNSYVITLQTNRYFDKDIPLFNELFNIAEKMSRYFGDTDLRSIVFVSAYITQTTSRIDLRISNCTLLSLPCNYITNKEIRQKVFLTDGTVDPKFRSALLPQYSVYNLAFSEIGSCLSTTVYYSTFTYRQQVSFTTNVENRPTRTPSPTSSSGSFTVPSSSRLYRSLSLFSPQTVTISHTSHQTLYRRTTLSSVTETRPPIVPKEIKLNVSFCGCLEFFIPNDTFHSSIIDSEDSLKLDLRYPNGSKLGCESWVQFDHVRRRLYGCPLVQVTAVLHKYQLTATDNRGLVTNTTVTIEVSASTRPNTTFRVIASMLINSQDTVCSSSVLFTLNKKIAAYFQSSSISFEFFTRSPSGVPSVVAFTFCGLRDTPCDFLAIRTYYLKLFTGQFLGSSKVPSPDFVLALKMEFTLLFVLHQLVGDCEENKVLEVGKPLKNVNVSMCGDFNYTVPEHTFIDPEDGSTRNLRLQLTQLNGKVISNSSWVQFDASSQSIYGFVSIRVLLEQPKNGYAFLLTAYDVVGARVGVVLSLKFTDTIPKYTCFYDKLFQCVNISQSIDAVVNIFRKISSEHHANFRLLSYTKVNNSIRIQWTNCTASCYELTYSATHTDNCQTVNRTIIPIKLNPGLITLNVSSCISVQYRIPKAILSDHANPNIIRFLDKDNKIVGDHSWIHLNPTLRTLTVIMTQAIINTQQVTKSHFRIIYENNQGLINYTNVLINVSTSARFPSVVFITHLENTLCTPLAPLVREFALHAKNYLTLDQRQSIELLDVSTTGNESCIVKINWTICDFPSNSCDHKLLASISKKITFGGRYFKGNITAAFRAAVNVTSFNAILRGHCLRKPPEATISSLILNITYCGIANYTISEDTFVAAQGGNARNLSLSLTPRLPWIFLNQNTQTIFIIPVVDAVQNILKSNKSIFIIATDKWNLTAKLRVFLRVPQLIPLENFILSFHLISYVNSLHAFPEVEEILNFGNAISNFVNLSPEVTSIVKYSTVQKFPRYINVSLSFCNLFVPTCNLSLVETITKQVIHQGNIPHLTLLRALLPNYVVKRITKSLGGSCVNKPPYANASALYLNATLCHQIYFPVPDNLFIDPDSNKSLRYQLLHNDGSRLDQKSWLQFNASSKVIFGILTVEQLESWTQRDSTFLLQAMDETGASSNVTVYIKLKNTTSNFPHELSFLFYGNNSSDDKMINKLIGKLASFLATSSATIAPIRLARNIDVTGINMFTWANCSSPIQYCDEKLISALNKLLVKSKGYPTDALIEKFSPEFTLSYVYQERKGLCRNASNNRPIVKRPLKPLNVSVCSPVVLQLPADTFFDVEDGGTRQLFVYLQLHGGLYPPTSSMLQFDIKTQTLYIFAANNTIRQNILKTNAILYARDQEGKTVSTNISFQLQTSTRSNFILSFKVSILPGTFPTDVSILAKFWLQLSSYLRNASVLEGQLGIKEYSRQVKERNELFILKVSLCGLSGPFCEIKNITEILATLVTENDTLVQSFAASMKPDFNITYVRGVRRENCLTHSVNTPPYTNASIPNLYLSPCKLLSYTVANHTFLDKEDGNIWNLTIQLYSNCTTRVLADDPLQFDATENTLMGYIPGLLESSLSLLGKRVQYCLVAKDAYGLNTSVSFIVQMPDLLPKISHAFITLLRYYNNKETTSVNILRVVTAKLQSYIGGKSSLIFLDLKQKSRVPITIEMTWSNCNWSNTICERADIKRFEDQLIFPNGHPNPFFIRAMAPEFLVLSTTSENRGVCNTTINTSPVASFNLTLNLTFCHKNIFSVPDDLFYDKEEGNTTHLRLSVTNTVSNKSVCVPVVYLNDTTKTIQPFYYYSAIEQALSLHLQASDSQGLTALTWLIVNTMAIPSNIPYQLSLLLTTSINDSVCKEYTLNILARKLRQYTGYRNLIFTSLEWLNGTQVLRLNLSECSVANYTCNHDNIQHFRTKFILGDETNDEAQQAMRPEFRIIKVDDIKLRQCSEPSLSIATVSLVTRQIGSLFSTMSFTKSTPFSTISTVPVGLPKCGKNTPPVIINSMTQIDAIVGKPAEYIIPRDTVYDAEDGDTTNITVTLLDENRREFNHSWIFLDTQTKRLYVAVTARDLINSTSIRYLLRFRDSCAAEIYDSLIMEVTGRVSCCYLVSVTYNATENAFLKTAFERKVLYDKLIEFYENSYIQLQLYSISTENNYTVVMYTNSSLRNGTCRQEDIDRFSAPILKRNGNVQPSFSAFFSNPGVLSVRGAKLKSCNSTFPVAPIVPIFIPPVAARASTQLNWLYWLLPFLCIAFLLFIGCLIFYCCLKCRVSDTKAALKEVDNMRTVAADVQPIAPVEENIVAAAAAPNFLMPEQKDSEEENHYTDIAPVTRVPPFRPRYLFPGSLSKPLWEEADTVNGPSMNALSRQPRLVLPRHDIPNTTRLSESQITEERIQAMETTTPVYLEDLQTELGRYSEGGYGSEFSEMMTHREPTRTTEAQTSATDLQFGLRLPALPPGPPPPYSPPRPRQRYHKLPSYEDATSQNSREHRQSRNKIPVTARVPVQFRAVARSQGLDQDRMTRRRRRLVLLKDAASDVRPTFLEVDQGTRQHRLHVRPPQRTRRRKSPLVTDTDYGLRGRVSRSKVTPYEDIRIRTEDPRGGPPIQSSTGAYPQADGSISAAYGYSQQPQIVPLHIPYILDPSLHPYGSRNIPIVINSSTPSYFLDPLLDGSVVGYPEVHRPFRYSPYLRRRRVTRIPLDGVSRYSLSQRNRYSPYLSRNLHSLEYEDFGSRPHFPRHRPVLKDLNKRRGIRNKIHHNTSLVHHTLLEADRQIEAGSVRRSINESSELEDSDEMTERIKTWLRESQVRRPTDGKDVRTHEEVKRGKREGQGRKSTLQENTRQSNATTWRARKMNLSVKKKGIRSRRRPGSVLSARENKIGRLTNHYPLSDLTEVSETNISGGKGKTNNNLKRGNKSNTLDNQQHKSMRVRTRRPEELPKNSYLKLSESENEDSF